MLTKLMKKNYIYLLLILILVSLVFYLFQYKSNKGTIGQNIKDFSVQDTASITKVTITNKQGKILTVQRTKAGWFVNDSIPARKDIVNILLETIKRVEVKSPVNKPMRENVMKQLATSSIKVQIYEEDDLLKCFFVGGATMEGTGTFMLLEDASEPVITHIPGFEGYLTVRFNSNPEVWRDREIFRNHPAFIDIIKVDYPQNPKESFLLKIQNREFVGLSNGSGEVAKNNVNADFLRNYLEQYMDVQYENLINLAQSTKDSVICSQNLLASITLVDKEGVSKNAKIYKRYWDGRAFVQKGKDVEFDLDRVFVVINDKVIANGQYRTFNRLIVRYQDFFNAPVKALN